MTDVERVSEAIDIIESEIHAISNNTDDESMMQAVDGLLDSVDTLELELKITQMENIDTDEIIEHLETIHVESQVIHDHLHSHEQEISDYGWPRPNPLTAATESEVLSEDLIHALKGDESGAVAFIKAIDSGDYAEYATESSHQLITLCDHHDFDFVVEPNSDVNYHATDLLTDLLDHIDTEIRNELDLKVSRQMCNNEDGTVLVGIADDHPLFQ